MAFSIAKRRSIYIYDVKILALQGAPYICDITRLRVNSHIPCRSPDALIYPFHATPLPFYDSAVPSDGRMGHKESIGKVKVTL
jgi:hypothetical protein